MPYEQVAPGGVMAEPSFNKKGYRTVLETALDNGYSFRLFDEPRPEACEKFCLLRHDVDADLEAAWELAEVDAELGIRATFFLMLRSPIYNLFSRANHTYVRRIMDKGHAIGLHYDEGFWPGDEHGLAEWIAIEAGVIEAVFSTKVRVVSFHQPGPSVLNNEFQLPEFINTYDRAEMRGIQYISDSSKVWKEKDILHVFRESLYPRIQLLIHPMWWAAEVDEPAPVIWEKTLVASFRRAQEQILATERAYGEEREFIIRALS